MDSDILTGVTIGARSQYNIWPEGIVSSIINKPWSMNRYERSCRALNVIIYHYNCGVIWHKLVWHLTPSCGLIYCHAWGHSAFCYKFSLLTGMNHFSEPLTLFVLSLPVGIVWHGLPDYCGIWHQVVVLMRYSGLTSGSLSIVLICHFISRFHDISTLRQDVCW